MTLSAQDRVLYARHLLLSQLGEAGQERLLAAAVAPSIDADEGALAVAQNYLERAGVKLSADGEPLALPESQELAGLAGSPELLEAARALAGALAAVHAIANAAGIAHRPAPLINISSEDV